MVRGKEDESLTFMKLLIIANWKCNPTTLTEAKRLFETVKRGIRGFKNIEIAIAPPFVFLSLINNHLSIIKLAGQNCFWENSGAYTGEISASMLKDVGCKYVILGHSERRRYFGETDELINKKIKAALTARLSPIFCIGETLEERTSGKTKEALERQIIKGLDGVARHWIYDTIFAYEPAWAISTFDGKAADCNEILTCNLLIRKIVSKLYGPKIANAIKILYGGSVTSKNARDFIMCSCSDGLLIGGTSLNATEFINIIKNLTTKKPKN